jgi:hypothetical protein
MSYCNTCHKISCTCPDNCGCLSQINSKCVFYKSTNLECIDVIKGDDLEKILKSLNTIVCDLQAPSGLQYVVDSCDGNITVSTDTTDGVTTYTVCLSSDITDAIENNTTNISTLSACVQNGVVDIVSDTAIITEDSSSDCGRVLRIEIPAPSGTPTLDGIIYNNTDKDGTTGGVGDKTLKSFNWNYSTLNSITDSDEIRIRATGQIFPDGVDVDVVKLQLFDATGASILWEDTFSGFDKVNKQSWMANLSLVVVDVAAGDGLLTAMFIANSTQNGTKSAPIKNTKEIVDFEVSGIDYSNLTFKVIYEHNCTSGATYNFARNLMVEVRKFIG